MFYNRPIEKFRVTHKKTGKELLVSHRTFNPELHEKVADLKKMDDKKVARQKDEKKESTGDSLKEQEQLVESLLKSDEPKPAPKRKPARKLKKTSKADK